MTKQSKYGYGIRGKLISAVCMLLVALIMVVSSTYAWFTLSTAPEVTGITTAVGANGALEMLLVTTKDGNPVYNDGPLPADAAWNVKNTYWGNLVDLSSNPTNFYGLDKITLYPSQLNVNSGILQDTLLMTSVYGADGRVSDVKPNTITGTYDTNKGMFYPNDSFGVRGVGVSSGLTDRQLSYRNARSAAATAMAQAKNLASQSLNNNGSALANVALKRATSNDATYTQEDVSSLKAIVDDLLGTDTKTGALQYIEEAYMQYILAYAASSMSGDSDVAWNAVKSLVEADSATLVSVLQSLPEGVSLSQEIKDAIKKYNGYNFETNVDDTVINNKDSNIVGSTVDNVETAKTKLDSLTGDSISWDDLSSALYLLADTENMKVNGIKASEIQTGNNMSTLVNSVAGSGLVVSMASGGGVYADIADHCGNYSASVTIEKVTYGGFVLNNMAARMETESTIVPSYLTAVGTYVQSLTPPTAAENSMPISEFYGYVIDLAFRTNAAESNLLLQTNGVDRIYDDNSNEETLGGGSTMTFAATTTDFKNDQVKSLMNGIRIVFFDPKGESGNEILAYAKLDTAKAAITADGITADMYIYETVVEYQYSKTETGENGDSTSEVTCYAIAPGQYYSDSNCSTLDEYANTKTNNVEFKATGNTFELRLDDKDAVITALNQNATQSVSALVYLDGAAITNKDVASTASTSMTGKMNLQFSSSANLVPMEYADLHIPSNAEEKTVPMGDNNQTVTVANATTYESSNTNVLTVDNDGKITTVTAGTATITAKDSSGNVLKTWKVTVTAATT